MDGQTGGLIGGIIGGLVGIGGGIVGTYFAIKNTSNEAQRAFMIKASIAMWAALIVLVLLVVLAIARAIPQWLYWSYFALFFLALTPAILWTNKRLAELRGGDSSPRSE